MPHRPVPAIAAYASCLTFILSLAAHAAAAQGQQEHRAGDSTFSTGRTVLPDNKGQLQPQGWTGPISTGSGGAPASSPQGGTPPDMQPAPGGASKTIVDPQRHD